MPRKKKEEVKETQEIQETQEILEEGKKDEIIEGGEGTSSEGQGEQEGQGGEGDQDQEGDKDQDQDQDQEVEEVDHVAVTIACAHDVIKKLDGIYLGGDGRQAVQALKDSLANLD